MLKLFLFPLGETVLHPGTSKPLNIFEPRYLKMIEDAVSSKTPIALGFVDKAKASVAPAKTAEGTTVSPGQPDAQARPEIFFEDQSGFDPRVRKHQFLNFVRPVVGYGHPEIFERRPDGTLLISIYGEGKARLGQVIDDRKPYIVIDAEVVAESYDLDPTQALQYLNLQRRLVRWMGDNIEDDATREHFIAALAGPRQVVGAINAFLINDPDMQQMILEANDVNEKINLLSGILNTGQFS